jgi:hypothetical protein
MPVRPLCPTGNHLLDRLPATELDRLLSGAELVSCPDKKEVYGLGAVGLAALRQGEVLEALVRRYLAVSWQSANQNIACSQRHTVRQRTCRWLLSVHDRTEADEFPITQEMLAQMVGASRQKVTGVAGGLQKAGVIRYHRGKLRVVNRPGLEAASCECYRTLKAALEVLTS